MTACRCTHPEHKHAGNRGRCFRSGCVCPAYRQPAQSLPRVAPPKPPPPPAFLTANEVAKRLRVSKMTAYRLIHSGDLPAIKIGVQYRVRATALDKFIWEAEVEE